MREQGRKGAWVRRLRSRLAEAQNQRCAYCFRRFGEHGKRSVATIDEVVARKHGGKRKYMNCVAACDGCNTKRGHGSALQFAAAVLAKRQLHDWAALSPTKKWRMWKRREGPHPLLGRPPAIIYPERGWW